MLINICDMVVEMFIGERNKFSLEKNSCLTNSRSYSSDLDLILIKNIGMQWNVFHV